MWADRRLGAASLALAVCAACGGTAESDPPAQDTPRYTELDAQIFRPACTLACHSGGEFAGGGLDMTAPASEVLVDVPAVATACAGEGFSRVVAGRPEESLLYLKIVAKLDGTEAPCGDGMPAGPNKPALTSEEVEQVRAWIVAGAPDD